jgi:hypothetical protein
MSVWGIWMIVVGVAGFLCGYLYRWRGVPFVTRRGIPFVGRVPRFTIGIYGGTSLSDLAPPANVQNPAVVPNMIRDVRCRVLADPFLLQREGKWFMFMEVLNRARRCGEIGYATSPDGCRWSYQAVVLREPFHLSYPFVFEHQDAIWMIPETSQDHSVRLYRAQEFPTQWRLETRLLEGHRWTDPSVFQYAGLWWMFVSRNVCEDLLLYFAEELTGPWRPHPGSPIVYAQPEKARCAGRPVHLNGSLIRFAQDCSGAYGRCVRAFRIERLDPEHYQESELSESPVLGPSGEGWNTDGMHHIDLHVQADGPCLAAVDGWRWARDIGWKY